MLRFRFVSGFIIITRNFPAFFKDCAYTTLNNESKRRKINQKKFQEQKARNTFFMKEIYSSSKTYSNENAPQMRMFKTLQKWRF